MQKRTLLVIEDNEINKEFLVSSLVEKYHILSAENGRAGLEILNKREEEISAILLDIQMPVMNGFEFLEYVAQNTVFAKFRLLLPRY